MNPINAVALGVLVALALKRRNAQDNLEIWRWIAGGVGALFPYSEVFLFFMGEGVWAQGSRALLWTLLVMPISAVGLAGILGFVARRSWEDFFYPVVGGLGAAWVLGALTERGIFPLAMLWDYRLSLGVLDTVDIILLGMCLVGLGMAYAFKIYDRDLARLTLGCAVLYVALVASWSVQARQFGHHYAGLQGMKSFKVMVEPQMLSPLNWRVTVVEFSGKVHDTLISLGRGGAKEERVGPFKPREEAVWRVFRRYGDESVGEMEQRNIRRTWYAWQVSPFGWMGRYTVFERVYAPQETGLGIACMGFKDIRDEVKPVDGTFVVCPIRERVRVLRPDGEMDKNGLWLGMHELVAYEGVR